MRRNDERPAVASLGFSREEEEALGPDKAMRLKSFRLLILIANALRNLTDRLYAEDGLTTQQAAVLTIAKAHGSPSFSECAAVLATSHQNVKQLAMALERKGFLRIVKDAEDGRVRRLRTTAKNDRYWAARDPKDQDEVLRAFASLSPTEARALFRLLVKVREGLAVLDGRTA